MLAIAYYLLKVIICSGILYGYYRIALHNKIFHRWNRFYLLFAVVISLSLPLIRISIGHTPGEDDSQVVRLLNIVTTGDEYVYNISQRSGFHLTGEQVAGVVYMMVSAIFLVLLLHTLIKLNRLILRNPLQKIQSIKVVQTEAKGTPFSFFRYIFWNRNIDMRSAAGEKIFRHEMVHVTEKHSADRLFMNIVLIFFWCNPFFWLIRQEINMIHEFIADKKTIEDKDTGVFASMILHAVYPQQAFGITSSFFSSSIKRRLLMLTKMQNPVLNYISRLLALPLLTLVFVAFTVKTKQLLPGQNEMPAVKAEQPITVVIDAGHGGDDAGARSRDGLEGTIHYSQDTIHQKERHPFTSNINVSANKDWKPVSDTLPAHIKSVDITKDNQVIIIYKNNTAEKITKAEAVKRGLVSKDDDIQGFDSGRLLISDSVLCFIDGNEVSKYELEKISPDEIEAINVLKDKTATDKYGERAKRGAIEIILKKRNTAAGRDVIFQKTEEAPRFPGGDAAWTQYISRSIDKVIDSLQAENKSGTCLVQFIVDTEGNLSGVKPLTMEGTFFAKTVTDAIRNGPKWIPAMQNGHKVSAYHKLSVKFRIWNDANGRRYTKTDISTAN